MASSLNTPTTSSYDPWQSSTATSTTVVLYITPVNSAVNYEVIEEIKKPKYRPPPGILKETIPPKQLKSRHGFQQMCRLPCYRGARTR